MYRTGLISAMIYSSVSLLAAGLFFAITVLTGDYDWVARLGGAAWVFVLSIIILMPTVTPYIKKRLS